ncbi:hypothetical protein VC74_gp85 [Mycobacterium phage Sparky]|uniref:Uncharacterized protein n=1 Tax=Mycobacterium phage Sparky TaxID=1527493 RepID=A0A076GDS7_9CAUD|nr:hypothetical protein VC74_gp85 [Mycobacterium phage Sparky]AII28185.1 hypothetical protein PBI_SPARKY_41 [Mycobacterium phage Sparky]
MSEHSSFSDNSADDDATGGPIRAGASPVPLDMGCAHTVRTRDEPTPGRDALKAMNESDPPPSYVAFPVSVEQFVDKVRADIAECARIAMFDELDRQRHADEISGNGYWDNEWGQLDGEPDWEKVATSAADAVFAYLLQPATTAIIDRNRDRIVEISTRDGE